MIAQLKAAPIPKAEKPRDFDHLSFSALSLYQQCPLRFYFRYLARLPEETIASSLVYGSSIHSALQYHFEQLLIGKPMPNQDTLLAVFHDAWTHYEGQKIQFGKGEDKNSLSQLAGRMLHAFQKSALAQPAGRIIAIEEELRGQVVAGSPDLLARIDLLVETADAFHLTDFKTTRSQWSQGHVEEAGSQLLLYSELVKPLTDGKPLRLAFAVMTKTKKPELAIHPVQVNAQQVKRTKTIVERVWRAIQAGHIYPNPSQLNCHSCPYRKPCRDWIG
jgi:CRISPR/Cas system-associated exonuclease Cas4 (RecB family)